MDVCDIYATCAFMFLLCLSYVWVLSIDVFLSVKAIDDVCASLCMH